jgi:hypothetical protein
MLVRASNQWAKIPLSVKVALITDGNRSFVALGLPRTISCGCHFAFPYGIYCRVLGIGSSIQPFCHLLCTGKIASPFAFSVLVALSPLVRERWHVATIVASVPMMRALVIAVGRHHPTG